MADTKGFSCHIIAINVPKFILAQTTTSLTKFLQLFLSLARHILG